jgi:hypothetical protein
VTRSSPADRPFCPSAQPDWPGAVVIGTVAGSADEPHVVFTDEPVGVSEEVMKLARPVHPTEVFRFAAPCLCTGCLHFDSGRCSLVQRVVRILPSVTDDLPACPIRSRCRWWLEEGRAACLRCPQVVTENTNPSEEMVVAARPAPRQADRHTLNPAPGNGTPRLHSDHTR